MNEERIVGTVAGIFGVFFTVSCAVASWRDTHWFPLPMLFGFMGCCVAYATIRLAVWPLVLAWRERVRPPLTAPVTDPYRVMAEREVERILNSPPSA